MNILPCCRWLALLCLALWSLATHLHAKTLFQPNDIVALVGGEDMVAAAECGELEMAITTALPEHRLKFRSLAWEGDTVYEQHRDLNYPTLEHQLEKIGATVVICQFGAMESLDGEEKLPEFVSAYENLLQRLSAGGKRRVIVLTPCYFEQSLPLTDTAVPWAKRKLSAKAQESLGRYLGAIRALSDKSYDVVNVSDLRVDEAFLQRDGIHLTRTGHAALAAVFASNAGLLIHERNSRSSDKPSPLQQGIIEKNRLWFNYYRPQNWAFLAGDRTNQPSSRDHRDPSKRWFPEELEQFLPLIEKKENEIHALVKEVAK